MKKYYDENDLEFMSSLSEASVAKKAPSSSRKILWVIAIAVFWVILWASIAEVDELTRGEGKVIPTQQLQVIQNLEGGIVSEILVAVVITLKKGQVLLRIDDKNFASSFGESRLRYVELKAKSMRLEAEANAQPFSINNDTSPEMQKQIAYEKSLYDSNQEQLLKIFKFCKNKHDKKRMSLRS